MRERPSRPKWGNIEEKGKKMNREDFFYPSADGKTQIHAVRWIPDGEVRAVLQIAHGMAEYIDRYEPFASECCKKGILVTGNDHLGHGKSVTDPSKLGYFAKENANRTVLEDMDSLKKLTAQKYPGIPYFLLGHSMGSFLCRQFISIRPEGLAGAVVMGTGNQPGYKTAAAKLLCRLIASVKGWEYRSDLINGMAFGSYNGKFGAGGGVDWLNTRKECVKKYEDDPLCGFLFTLNAYYGMFDSIHQLSEKAFVERIPKELPILIVSGEDDPVGEFGRNPVEVAEEYKSLGIRDVSLILYPGDRHEILNEKDREKVIGDITGWIEKHIS